MVPEIDVVLPTVEKLLATGIESEHHLKVGRRVAESREDDLAADAIEHDPAGDPNVPRSNLVIARAGRGSLHPAWLTPAQPRNWDLMLCPYQPLPPQDTADITADITVGEVRPGPKWTGLRELLSDWQG